MYSKAKDKQETTLEIQKKLIDYLDRAGAKLPLTIASNWVMLIDYMHLENGCFVYLSPCFRYSRYLGYKAQFCTKYAEYPAAIHHDRERAVIEAALNAITEIEASE
jgi:hypothetical protein